MTMSKEQRAKSKAVIKNFSDLNAWQESHKLYVEIHKISKRFLRDELFGLTNQVRRAALSVSSNIAEGFGRSSDLEKIHFYTIARGSLFEVQYQLLAAGDISLINDTTYDYLEAQSQNSKRLLIGLINATRSRLK